MPISFKQSFFLYELDNNFASLGRQLLITNDNNYNYFNGRKDLPSGDFVPDIPNLSSRSFIQHTHLD